MERSGIAVVRHYIFAPATFRAHSLLVKRNEEAPMVGITDIIDETVRRERREVEAIEAEIKKRGTWWAAQEIFRLCRKAGEPTPREQARRDAEKFLRAPAGLEYAEPEDRRGLTQAEIDGPKESFGRLLASAPIEEGDIPERVRVPHKPPSFGDD